MTIPSSMLRVVLRVIEPLHSHTLTKLAMIPAETRIQTGRREMKVSKHTQLFNETTESLINKSVPKTDIQELKVSEKGRRIL